MDTPTPSASAWTDWLTRCFKPELLDLPAYPAPSWTPVRVKLDQNESPDESLDGDGVRWNRYPPSRQQNLIDRLAAHHGVGADQLLLGHGSNSLLYTMGSALLQKGDAVLVSPPTFPLYEMVARLGQAALIQVPRRADWSYDIVAMEREAARCKLVFVASPDTPTGVGMNLTDLERLLNTCPGFVLWDEAYGEFGSETAVPLLNRHPNLLVLKTASKAWALAGARLGWLMGRPEAIMQFHKAAVPFAVGDETARLASAVLDRWPRCGTARVPHRPGTGTGAKRTDGPRIGTDQWPDQLFACEDRRRRPALHRLAGSLHPGAQPLLPTRFGRLPARHHRRAGGERPLHRGFKGQERMPWLDNKHFIGR